MKKSRIVLLCILLCVIVDLVIVIFYNIIDIKPKKDNKSVSLSVEIETIPLCVSGVDCGFQDMEFRNFKLSGDNPKLEKVVNKINSEVDNIHKEVVNSDTSSAECSGIVGTYQYSIFAQTMLPFYNDSNIVSLALISSSSNLCTNTMFEDKFIVYYYDVKEDKFISQEELEERYNINRSEVMELIKTDLVNQNQVNGTNYSSDSIKDFKLYIDFTGDIQAFYTLEGSPSGYSVTINKNVK